jgi:hypothetical protein
MNAAQKFWLQWILACSLGGEIGALISITLIRTADIGMMQSLIGSGVVVGGTVALAQEIALKGKIPGWRWWLLVSGMCSAILISLAPFLFFIILGSYRNTIEQIGGDGFAFSLYGFVSGVITGLLQWLVFLKKFPGSGWWISV